MSRIQRRQFLIASLALLAAPSAAQVRDRMRRIGFLNSRSGPNQFDAGFRDTLKALGYVEGRTIQIDFRWAAGSEKRAEDLAAELVAQKVEVIVVATTLAIRAAMRATRTIPIVMAASADPVGAGLVASLARPGGNVTGLSLVSTDTGAKRLQLLRELIPATTRVAVLLQQVSARDEQVNSLLVEQLTPAALQLGLSLTFNRIASGAEITDAFSAMERERAQAVIVQASSVAIENGARIVELAARHRLPAMYEVEGAVDAGGLLSYGPSILDMYRRAAVYVDKILKGASPADLPVEQPTKFELVVNLKTAKSLGFTVPHSILLRADRVID